MNDDTPFTRFVMTALGALALAAVASLVITLMIFGPEGLPMALVPVVLAVPAIIVGAATYASCNNASKERPCPGARPARISVIIVLGLNFLLYKIMGGSDGIGMGFFILAFLIAPVTLITAAVFGAGAGQR